VVEHYDDVAASLMRFQWKLALPNYTTPLKDHDHSQDQQRLATMAEDLPLQLHFTEEEEEALVEFLQHGLTDVRLAPGAPNPFK
jgi:hypothetical protein